MNEESIQLYREKLLEGTERAHNIRVMVVGHFGVGKTTLTRRLLGIDDVADISSTNGVDVHRCRVSLETGQWESIASEYIYIYIYLYHQEYYDLECPTPYSGEGIRCLRLVVTLMSDATANDRLHTFIVDDISGNLC
jgi:hypothetical protein